MYRINCCVEDLLHFIIAKLLSNANQRNSAKQCEQHSQVHVCIYDQYGIFSNYKDVIHLSLTCKITADELYVTIKKSAVGLKSIGFKVIAVITDNNAINRKAMFKFVFPPKLSIAYRHPSNQIQPLFSFF